MKEYMCKKWEEIHQDKPLFISLVSLLTLAVIFIVWGFVINTPAYSVYADGKEVCKVKKVKEVEQILAEIKEEKEGQYKTETALITKFEFCRTFASKDQVLAEHSLKKQLEKIALFNVKGAAIVVNGNPQVFLASRKEAERVLSRIKEEGKDLEEGEKLLELAFEENVTIKEELVPANKIVSPDEAYMLIKTGTESPEKYIVKEGDSLWLIARRNNMYVDDIMRANNLKSEYLQPGDELILVKSKPLINVIARVEGEKIEEIPYETKIVIDKNVPYSVRVKQKGQNGEKKVVYVAVKKNGVTQDREIKQETIIKKAVDKIVVKGTKVIVASRGSSTVRAGKLIWPVYGTITSPFGARGGRHTGVDIAARTGTPIKAADSGTVIFAGWQGGYGKFVIVDHGNGIVTRYAHCNKIYVSTGQRVNRGDVIASVGSTGNSTGPHLHFETLVYGSFRNPLNFLR
ncbi:M23 family metallopeptidase [Thermosyntropha sp.]|uniref:M23 family metallopeptidase n=1 Tax=Thermosyntropha sp. TaxID=2740820 RepID=UPI0025F82D42|nr:M23 family metallopeptidase [Thermosyntropha sp.]MBO8159640.1 M23 family metallopeptidase [Thermosyntropha sp.]